ncbi:hypothetical protein [Kineococcus terrestris]|uniref:hypothetical protein n=1 Tax=Kineococcus terrestris TaxID=2044856 RepID=UPI0034DAC918
MTPTHQQPHQQPHQRRASRRAVLAGLAGAGTLAACSGGQAPAAQPSPAAPSPTPPPAPAPPPSPTRAPVVLDLPAPEPYVLLPGEVEPGCKEAAVDYVTTALTTGSAQLDPESPFLDVATALDGRLRAAGLDPAHAAGLLGLLPPAGVSAAGVVYPQYGGLSSGRRTASVILVAEQSLLDAAAPDELRRRTLTVDVRLVRSGDTWRVTDVLVPDVDFELAVPARPQVRAVLDDDRIALPDPARFDLLQEDVHVRVAELLSAYAELWPLAVQDVRSGHPFHVYDTDRPSNHTLGRAVDIRSFDGVPVIDQERCPWREAMEFAAAWGVTEVGGPVDLGPRPYFSDLVHQDHVHCGFGAAGLA